MIILGIETSCDETAAAVLSFDSAQDGEKSPRIQILSNVVASSASLQAKYGGIIPEQAAREQIKSIIPVIKEALSQAFPNYTLYPKPYTLINAIAVTQGPGLIGSLLVGVETAKVLSTIWNKPLIPVNHLIGHFYANWIGDEIPQFPCIGLLVSGGHTDLVLFRDHGKYEYFGGTRDDAAGECFDKCARLLGLPYPGGPEISKLAQKGKDIFKLPRPMMDSKDYDFSFSGLKTSVSNLVRSEDRVVEVSRLSERSELEKRDQPIERLYDIAASIEAAIVDVLVEKTVRAAQKYNIDQIIVAGGVAANQKLKETLESRIRGLGIKLHIPPPSLCTDNGAMIASAAFFLKSSNPLNLQADPNLSLVY